jgi:hypothetical protein
MHVRPHRGMSRSTEACAHAMHCWACLLRRHPGTTHPADLLRATPADLLLLPTCPQLHKRKVLLPVDVHVDHAVACGREAGACTSTNGSQQRHQSGHSRTPGNRQQLCLLELPAKYLMTWRSQRADIHSASVDPQCNLHGSWWDCAGQQRCVLPVPPTWSSCVAAHCCQSVAEESGDGLLGGGGRQATHVDAPRVPRGLLRCCLCAGTAHCSSSSSSQGEHAGHAHHKFEHQACQATGYQACSTTLAV